MLSDMDMDIGLLLIYDKNVITLKLRSGAYTPYGRGVQVISASNCHSNARK